MISKAPKHRLEREKEKRVKQFEEEILSQYLKQHSKVTKDAADDYKRNAVNNALVEMFCSGEKYRSKNKHLIEKSKAMNTEWILLRDSHNVKINKQLKKTM